MGPSGAARLLQISIHGAKRYVSSILRKQDSPTRTVAVAKALTAGLLDDGR